MNSIVRQIIDFDDFRLFCCPAGASEYYLTLVVTREQMDTSALCKKACGALSDQIKKLGIEVVHERAFGNLTAYPCYSQARAELFQAIGGDRWPCTYVQGRPLTGSSLAGIQIQAVKIGGAIQKVWSITQTTGTEPVGRAWGGQNVTFISLQNLHGMQRPGATNQQKMVQAKAMFQSAQEILQKLGSDYRQVVRTWIYMENILDWYADFNVARNDYYQKWGLMPDLAHPDSQLKLPASTGIRGDAPHGGACFLDLFAIQSPKGMAPPIEQLSNQQQQDAFRYGKAFSRGALIHQHDHQLLHVSGTAAIDEQGQSLFHDDFCAQTNETLDKIAALVKPHQFSLDHVCSATVFLKYTRFNTDYQRIIRERNLFNLPAVCVEADVCRPELLFEMDAILAKDTA